jgi:hypothetical protein
MPSANYVADAYGVSSHQRMGSERNIYWLIDRIGDIRMTIRALKYHALTCAM